MARGALQRSQRGRELQGAHLTSLAKSAISRSRPCRPAKSGVLATSKQCRGQRAFAGAHRIGHWLQLIRTDTRYANRSWPHRGAGRRSAAHASAAASPVTDNVQPARHRFAHPRTAEQPQNTPEGRFYTREGYFYTDTEIGWLDVGLRLVHRC
jgi:hypothetical protein